VAFSRRTPNEGYVLFSRKANSSNTYLEERLTANTDNKLQEGFEFYYINGPLIHKTISAFINNDK